MSASQALLIGAWMLFCSVVLAADEEEPNMEFLEYLGMWEESDEDWLILDEARDIDKVKRSDPVPQGEESTEKHDAS
ncbi:MAG: hypothetical protein OEO82_02085 [Gammaproteobacteria bacterium]|nr:hypothetical protein [Gammaproteobacteria bacterium]